MLENFDPNEGYRDYYVSGLELDCFGIKYVVGGTGLGKTYGASSAINYWWNTKKQRDRKFIYVASRKTLLASFKAELEKKSIKSIQLHSDSEILQNVSKSQSDWEKLCSLIDSREIEKARAILVNTNRGRFLPRPQKLHQQLNEFKNLVGFAENEQVISSLYEERLSLITSKFFKFLKKILAEIDANPKLEKERLAINKHHRSILFKLFPFWEFEKNEEVVVLTVTIQKLLKGFFNGKKQINFSKISDYVVFLDEFDFLEEILLKEICEEDRLPDPINFLATFYDNMQRKLADKDYPFGKPEVRAELEGFQEYIEKLQTENELNFPHIRQFDLDREFNEFREGLVAIFQSSFITLEEPVFLHPDEGSRKFYISKDSKGQKSFPFFRRIIQTSKNILDFFQVLNWEEPVVFEEILEDAFGSTEFLFLVKRQTLRPAIRSKQIQQPTHIFTHLLRRGYGLFGLLGKEDITEPNEIQLQYYSVSQSPENLLFQMIRKNFVFALSATAMIPREVGYFDEAYLRTQIECEIPDKGALILPERKEKLLLEELRKRKAKRRKNRIQNSTASKHIPGNLWERVLQFLAPISGFDEILNTSPEYRQGRLRFFINSLIWAKGLHRPAPNECNSHLLFMHSTKQVEFLLKSISDESLKDVPSIDWRCKRDEDFPVYRLRFQDCCTRVIILTSDTFRRFENSKKGKYDSFFDFKEGPVLVVTTYPSAAQGVNLQYNRANGSAEDFFAVHLLESPYHYFSGSEDEGHDDGATHTKENVWRLAKLSHAGKMSGQQFRKKVHSELKPQKYSTLNHWYYELPDAQSNRVAQMFQAIGRIERIGSNPQKGNNPVGIQYIRASENAKADFRGFFDDPNNSDVIEGLRPFLSQVILDFVEQIGGLTNSQAPTIQWEKYNKNCQHKLHEKFLSKLGEVQSGKISKEKALKLASSWKKLRTAALSHDFLSSEIQEVEGVVTSTSIGKTSTDLDLNLFGLDSETVEWQFNSVYTKFRQMKEIRTYFYHRGFQLEYQNHRNNSFFVPYFFQAVFIPAIAEEVFREVFRLNGIETMNPEIHDYRLWELADLYLPKNDIFVDVKYYSQETILNLSFGGNRKAKLTSSSLFNSAIKKVNILDKKGFSNSRIAYINTFSEPNAGLQMFQSDGSKVDNFANARIIFVPGLFDLVKLETGISETTGPDPTISIEDCSHKSFSHFLHLITQ